VKKLILFIFILCPVLLIAQDSTGKRKASGKAEKKEERRQRVNDMMKQAEEGVLIYSKQTLFGMQFRSNGYGAYFELGRSKSNRRTNIYRFDFTEIKHPKEDKEPNAGIIFGNPYIFAKRIISIRPHWIRSAIHLGQKGNRTGSRFCVYNGGLPRITPPLLY
jgi:hypothetical protein